MVTYAYDYMDEDVVAIMIANREHLVIDNIADETGSHYGIYLQSTDELVFPLPEEIARPYLEWWFAQHDGQGGDPDIYGVLEPNDAISWDDGDSIIVDFCWDPECEEE